MPRSITQPNAKVTTNATPMPTTKNSPIAPGSSAWKTLAVT